MGKYGVVCFLSCVCLVSSELCRASCAIYIVVLCNVCLCSLFCDWRLVVRACIVSCTLCRVYCVMWIVSCVVCLLYCVWYLMRCVYFVSCVWRCVSCGVPCVLWVALCVSCVAACVCYSVHLCVYVIQTILFKCIFSLEYTNCSTMRTIFL